MNMCELTLAVSHPPTGEEQVVSSGVKYRGIRLDLGGVSQSTLAPTILSSFYLYYVIL